MTKIERLEKQKHRFVEMTEHENELRASGIEYIAGMDEVGRGPLAGPVYAAAVVLPADFDVIGIDDSKKLSEKKRTELDKIIRDRALAFGIGIASNREIDEMNILNATKIAMKRAIKAANEMLPEESTIEHILIDAVHLDDIDIPQESIIKGDQKCISIAAASIVAKVARDSFMAEMSEIYPGYGFERNKGYGTEAHYNGLRELGMTPLHRKTFLRKFENSCICKSSEDTVMSGKKIYAVRKGKTTGLFNTWDECRKNVDGFSGAEYKSFSTIGEARVYLGEKTDEADDGAAKAYVDGSYDVATGNYSCGAVIINDGIETKLSRGFTDEAGSALRNVAGEIMGARMAIDYCLEHGIEKITIYHDYMGVGKWGDGSWKANLDMTREYKAYVAAARKKIGIKFVKVKAHSGNKYNEMADELAKEALGK